MAAANDPEPQPASERRSRGCVQAIRTISWADLLKRVHNIDSLACPRCGGRLRMLALIMQKDIVRRILLSLGLPCEPPVIARARAPTLALPHIVVPSSDKGSLQPGLRVRLPVEKASSPPPRRRR